jgi:hypothetical protein
MNTGVTDPFLAKPADLCCLKGAIHSGEPLGQIKQIGGVDTYVATPDPKTANGNVILFFPDAFGLYVNSLLMMDAYAAWGYLTLGVDYFVGVRMQTMPIYTHFKKDTDAQISGGRREVYQNTLVGSEFRL